MFARSAPLLGVISRAEGSSTYSDQRLLVSSLVGCVRLGFHVPALSTSALTTSYLVTGAARKTSEVDLVEF